jgi:hypothetical protein
MTQSITAQPRQGIDEMGNFDGWRDWIPRPGQTRPPLSMSAGKKEPSASGRRGKYNARPHAVLCTLEVVPADDPRADGARRFDSKREAARYVELRCALEAKEIEALELQRQFPLHVLAPDGVKVCIGRYIADFAYRRAGAVVIEDAKGFAGKELYVWKKKHVEAEYGVRIIEV